MADGHRAHGLKGVLAGFNWRSYAMIIALAAIALIFTYLTNGIFLSPRNVAQLLRQTAILVVVASGVAMLIIQREIDLSIGSAVYLTGLAAACRRSPSRWPSGSPSASGRASGSAASGSPRSW
jgi:D-xylose transport system permease protein